MEYQPSPWQREFHALSTDEAMGGGSQGPGKSMALLMDPLEQIVVQHQRCAAGEFDWGRAPGWALHLRREFPRLEQTIWRSKLLFERIDPGAKYDGDSHKWRFSSGFQYQFGHLKDSDTFLNYRSNEYSHLGIDEIIELDSKDVYDELTLRVRSTDPVLSKMLKVRSVTNPGAGWVRDYFVDPEPAGRVVLKNRVELGDGSTEERTRIFLPARLSDNPDPGFRRRQEIALRAKPPHIRAALFEGNWYVVPGAFFADAWDQDIVVIDPMRIPSGWKRFRSGDWGFVHPCVILWWAVSPEGELICYRERTFNGPKAKVRLDAWQVAQRIREIEEAHGEWDRVRGCSRLTGPMDTQLWEERGHRGPTMASDMAAEGVYWVKATKGRMQGAQQVMRRLNQRGYNHRPGVMFFRDCQNCIRTIPAIGTDETEPEKPKKQDGFDDWYKATEYACAYNPLPSGKEDRSEWDDDEQDEVPADKRGRFGYGQN